MTAADLDAVMAIEDAIYPHPWTRGNFSDSLAAGYHCWIVECGGEMVGYTVVMVAAGEAHLLNLSVAGAWQRRGSGASCSTSCSSSRATTAREEFFWKCARRTAAAIALYAAAGFAEIALRRGYYPAGSGARGRDRAAARAR